MGPTTFTEYMISVKGSINVIVVNDFGCGKHFFSLKIAFSNVFKKDALADEGKQLVGS